MASYFRSSVAEFLSSSGSEMLSRLTLGYARDGFSEMRTDAPLAWWNDIESLRGALEETVQLRPDALGWWVLLEFTVPRKASRLDVVLLAGCEIVVLECKTSSVTGEARRQAETYALLLHYFHKPSDRKIIRPLVVTETAVVAGLEAALEGDRQGKLGFEALPSFWVKRTEAVAWRAMPELLAEVVPHGGAQMDGVLWDEGAYRPTPTIIEAALALKTGLDIREIAHSEAAEHEVSAVVDEIHGVIENARAKRTKAICFVTGVPGSGKTLVGLSLAHLGETRADAIHFMSGNGPLVAVLQELFRRQAMKDGVRSLDAKIQAQALIENVHYFAKEYTERDPNRAPSNHVIIFDEAQRAWNLAQNLSKFKRNYSEPEMLLKIMDRHDDYACVVALVGGGQEINSGEAGLEEWGKAIVGSSSMWEVYASPEVIAGGSSTAGQRLFSDLADAARVQTKETLHLRTSNRSLRADKLALWVNHVLEGECAKAAELRIGDRFPLYLARSLPDTRKQLAEESLGDSRFGLVGSSGAARLRAEGLEPSSSFHAEYPWHHWYLADRTDVRSSFRCEVFATEFEVQGLELDWVGLCWGGDFVWDGMTWVARDLRQTAPSRWSTVKNIERQKFRRNAYRVLLTRARQGMVLFVPAGEPSDATRSPGEMDATAEYLVRCGVRLLGGVGPRD